MIKSTSPSWVASSPSCSRPPPDESETAAGGNPHAASDSPTSPASTPFEVSAALDPRSTTAFPLFRQSAAASMVTFGRAS